MNAEQVSGLVNEDDHPNNGVQCWYSNNSTRTGEKDQVSSVNDCVPKGKVVARTWYHEMCPWIILIIQVDGLQIYRGHYELFLSGA